jgi:flavin-binding protein dodecin
MDFYLQVVIIFLFGRRSQFNSNAVLHELMTHIAKVVEIIGGSDKGWSEAAQAALDEARKTIHGITGLEVNDITAKVDPSTGKITEYRVGVKIAFGVKHS